MPTTINGLPAHVLLVHIVVIFVPVALVEAAAPGMSSEDGAKPASPRSTARNVPPWASILIAALAVVVALGATVQLLRIADSGGKAVWTGVATSKG